MDFDYTKLAVTDIKSGRLKNILPELYNLEQIIENSDWHIDQNVFDHSVAALQVFDSYMKDKAELRNELEHDLLRVAVLLHDIGKLEAFYTDKDGRTHAPSHAEMGYWVAIPILLRLQLSSDKVAYAAALIKDHILVCDLLELSVKTGKKEYIKLLKAERPHTWRELLLISYADIHGCQATKEIKDEIAKRTALINSTLSVS